MGCYIWKKRFETVILVVLLAMGGLACGDGGEDAGNNYGEASPTADDEADEEELEGEGIGESDNDDASTTLSGLSMDPLEALQWASLPEESDVPDSHWPEIQETVASNSQQRLLFFDGEIDGVDDVYRAPILEELLDDDEFMVAIEVLSGRIPRVALEAGFRETVDDAGNHSVDDYVYAVYDPGGELPDLDAAFDASINETEVSAQLGEELADTDDAVIDEQGAFYVNVECRPELPSWEHFVDVIDSEEVASLEEAYLHGEQRRSDELDDEIDISIELVESNTTCQYEWRSQVGHIVGFSCPEAQLQELPTLNERVIGITLSRKVTLD